MNKNTFAKLVAWLGGALTLLAANGAFGKYSVAVASVAPLVTAGSVHLASNTSAGHPNG